jgi:hypothetical protein
VTHTCNPSYLRGWGQEDHGWRPAQANNSWDYISKKLTRTKWTGGIAQAVECLLLQALSLQFKPQDHKHTQKENMCIKGDFKKLFCLMIEILIIWKILFLCLMHGRYFLNIYWMEILQRERQWSTGFALLHSSTCWSTGPHHRKQMDYRNEATTLHNTEIPFES